MKEIEEIELHKLNEVELSEKEIKERKKWIEDAQKSGRIFLICIESFVVISIVLLVAVGAVSYEKNWLSPCIELKSKSGDVTCKTASFTFGFATQSVDEPQLGNIGSRVCNSSQNFIPKGIEEDEECISFCSLGFEALLFL
jgi:hypothetical protein